MRREPLSAEPVPGDEQQKQASTSESALPTLEALVQQRGHSRDPDTHTDGARSGTREPSSKEHDDQAESRRKDRFAAVSRGPSSVIQQTPKVLVLDLDETLIHSKLRSGARWSMLGGSASYGMNIHATPPGESAWGSSRLLSILGLGTGAPTSSISLATSAHAKLKPTVIEVSIDGQMVYYQVYKRPWVDYFLKKVASWYQVVIFTASMQAYADPVIDWLDGGQGLISGRLFRESCTIRDGTYLKDLTVVDRDLRRVCLVDNSPVSYVLQEANGIPVQSWTHDPNDQALLDLLPILDGLRYAMDVRHILGLRGYIAS
ncbi:protein-serine/threonine phosphatase [Malassezia yamatoensis]|uniref:Protein-serine/threonine phosphatase n=1 Tax=Malassezia yamatoensis TaxID=253288 RepID=A0AAJ5YUR5_9BASI|nr:protein-serine/threonine phosphatase [Malassezia yamatoensis]